eukprot:TRINITY_DN9722_c0_g1_i2.p1 TRINITY_DN9722_c0_g1~~TRINITY_DN9722_c0_g1_i2.p1  ORF type:complete len:176 (-),score=34.07 TRINITY_DN9722_c0_g1_i2:45-572(-)
MSFRGRGGRGGRGRGRGGSGGGFADNLDLDHPDQIIDFALFVHPATDMLVFKQMNVDKLPKFNAPVFLNNKQKIGTIDEIFGPINEVYFSVKPTTGIQPGSFKSGDKCCISPERLLPASMFDEAKQTGGGRGGRGGRGAGRGVRGFRGGAGRGTGRGFSPSRGRGRGSPGRGRGR